MRSIVSRFLEHTRVFHFHNDGDKEVYLSSADWMGRNFFSRVEACFLVEDKRLRDRIIREGLNNYLSDNTRAWILQPDGTYVRSKPRFDQGSRCAARSASKTCRNRARLASALLHFEFEFRHFEVSRFLVQVSERQWMLVEPLTGKLQLDGAAISFDFDAG